MDNNLLKLEEKLALQHDMIDQTESWWAITFAKKYSYLLHLRNQLQQTLDYSLVPEIDKTEIEVEHLKKKAIWEQKEIDSFNRKEETFEKLKSMALLSEFSNKLTKKSPSDKKRV